MFKYDCALIVDENPISNFVTKLTLEKINIIQQIITSTDLSETLDAIKKLEETNENCPEIIILDILGDEESIRIFLTILKELKLKNKETLKIILSTLNSARGIEKAKKFGFPYIKKPVTEEKLKAFL